LCPEWLVPSALRRADCGAAPGLAGAWGRRASPHQRPDRHRQDVCCHASHPGRPAPLSRAGRLERFAAAAPSTLAPLKALVNDAGRSLEAHLADLAAFLPPGTRVPRLAVRTGDTPADERRRLRDEPPDALLTTPESLAVLLSQPAYSPLLGNLAWVVVDEVHALAGNKRGADLALSLERLAALVRGSHPGGELVEPRRIGLSATATPLAEAARFLVGGNRSCTIARAPDRSGLSLSLEPLPEGNRFFSGLVERVARELPRQPCHAGVHQHALPGRAPGVDLAPPHAGVERPHRRASFGHFAGAASGGGKRLQGWRIARRRVEYQPGTGHRHRQRRSRRPRSSTRRRGPPLATRRPGRACAGGIASGACADRQSRRVA